MMIGCEPAESSVAMKSMLVVILVLLGGVADLGAEPRAESDPKVSPVLASHCQKCHGEDKQRGGFDVRSVEAIVRGSKTGKVVIPGQPERSLLLRLVAADGDPHMPPQKQM